MCNFILAGEYLSCIRVVIKDQPQGQKVNFMVTKSKNVIKKKIGAMIERDRYQMLLT